jgi:hypothetical protein
LDQPVGLGVVVEFDGAFSTGEHDAVEVRGRHVGESHGRRGLRAELAVIRGDFACARHDLDVVVLEDLLRVDVLLVAELRTDDEQHDWFERGRGSFFRLVGGSVAGSRGVGRSGRLGCGGALVFGLDVGG